MTEVHRYRVVKMLSESGNRISYEPHGPEVVMASAYDQLKADNERLKAELKKVDADRKACWAEFKVQGRQLDQLKTEKEALRNALMECTNYLQGEMLQKFGGQLPEDMYPLTRREYDRDIAEVSGYRAALGQGEQS
ncbi:hypothetical protein [Pseudomonas sp. HN8-3]|uniref:hypothetical protein n=1 Tax=Pseudomonas sp. HN8-3 TaxID=2886361 RepID=UPI001E2DF152|nr:hypothetical protein [Pseudomonas sp. HN8-3]UEH06323.1 hypothetical protein LJX92_15240 [Pseudomonas sp. HN8-3]